MMTMTARGTEPLEPSDGSAIRRSLRAELEAALYALHHATGRDVDEERNRVENACRAFSDFLLDGRLPEDGRFK